MFASLVLLMILGCTPIEIDDYKGQSDISIMSFNLRYDESADGDNQWNNRKEACVAMLKELKPTIIGIQEGLHNQVRYLDENLPNYAYVGVGRDDGYSSGEYAAIYYDSLRVELLDSGHFWLSETPESPSKGWDANNTRICTWAKFKDQSKDKEFYVFNTHFDHIGKVAQLESSKLMISKVNSMANNDTPVFLTGDFNVLIDSKNLAPITETYFSAQRYAERSDDNPSYNAWGLYVINRNIDFIFYKNAKALSYKTIVKDYGVPYISDHYPILSHFNFK